MARQRHRSKTSAGASRPLERSEALTFHGPGWTIRGADYEVVCWAPGQILHEGEPTGRHRNEWMLSVERDWVRHPVDSSGTWASGGFVSAESLAGVLDALALLDPIDRYQVTAVLVHELGGDDR